MKAPKEVLTKEGKKWFLREEKGETTLTHICQWSNFTHCEDYIRFKYNLEQYRVLKELLKDAGYDEDPNASIFESPSNPWQASLLPGQRKVYENLAQIVVDFREGVENIIRNC